MAKVIKCSNPRCNMPFAHLLDNGTLDIVRRMQHFTVVPSEGFILIGTCGSNECGWNTSLVVKDGKLQDDGVTFKKDKELEEDEQRRIEEAKPAIQDQTPANSGSGDDDGIKPDASPAPAVATDLDASGDNGGTGTPEVSGRAGISPDITDEDSAGSVPIAIPQRNWTRKR